VSHNLFSGLKTGVFGYFLHPFGIVYAEIRQETSHIGRQNRQFRAHFGCLNASLWGLCDTLRDQYPSVESQGEAIAWAREQIPNSYLLKGNSVANYTCDPNLEIGGHSARSLLESINRDNYFEILEKHGFTNIDPHAWYPVQDLLDVINDINERGGAMMDFVSIGVAAGANSILPPEIQALSLSEFFMAYGKVYQRIYRNGDAGEIQVKMVKGNHLAITLRGVPYPDDLMYGVFYGLARRFARDEEQFTLAYDNILSRRDNGGEYTTINLTWE
jgi:hypothetical protein